MKVIVNTKNTKKKSVVKTKNVNTLGFGKNYDKHKKHTFLNHETEKAETPYTELYVTQYIFLWNPHGNRPIFKMKTLYASHIFLKPHRVSVYFCRVLTRG